CAAVDGFCAVAEGCGAAGERGADERCAAAGAFVPALDAAAGFGDDVCVAAAGRAAGRFGATSAGCVASASSSPSARAPVFADEAEAAAGRGFDSRAGASATISK